MLISKCDIFRLFTCYHWASERFRTSDRALIVAMEGAVDVTLNVGCLSDARITDDQHFQNDALFGVGHPSRRSTNDHRNRLALNLSHFTDSNKTLIGTLFHEIFYKGPNILSMQIDMLFVVCLSRNIMRKIGYI